MQIGFPFKDGDRHQEKLIPASTVLSEMRRMRRQIWALELGLRALERTIIDDHARRPRRHHSFEPAALAYLVELHEKNPGAKSRELIKQLMDKSAERDWRIGSIKTIYRILRELRTGARLDISPGRGVKYGSQQARREKVGGAHRSDGGRG